MRREICSAAASSIPAPGFCSSVAKAHSVLAISWLVYWCSMAAARRAARSSTLCPGLYPSLLYDHRLLLIACGRSAPSGDVNVGVDRWPQLVLQLRAARLLLMALQSQNCPQVVADLSDAAQSSSDVLANRSTAMNECREGQRAPEAESARCCRPSGRLQRPAGSRQGHAQGLQTPCAAACYQHNCQAPLRRACATELLLRHRMQACSCYNTARFPHESAATQSCGGRLESGACDVPARGCQA